MRNDRRPDRRRSSNGHRIDEGGFSLKSALYVALIILALGLIAFFITINVYNKSLNKTYSDIETKAVGDAKDDESLVSKAEEASSQIGKTVEGQNSNEENVITQNDEVQVVHESENAEVQEQENANKNEEPKVENNAPDKKEEPKEEPVKDPEFEKPVEGERLKEFAKDRLVYSETLKEWTGHTGIDIKADKTTVVKASEARKSYSY